MRPDTRLPATIAEAGQRLRNGSLTSEALTRIYLTCIRELQPRLNAFITVADEQALAVDKLASLGADVKQVRIPLFEDKINYSYPLTILLYEFNQILGDEYSKADKSLFGPVVQANMARGSQIPKATYDKAIAERPKEIAEIREVFKQVDALLMPTHPMVAPLQTWDAEGSERVRQFTVPVSFTGFPAVSVPCGFSPSGLPIGLHIVGNDMQEALLLRIAATLEAATNFRERKPALYCG